MKRIQTTATWVVTAAATALLCNSAVAQNVSDATPQRGRWIALLVAVFLTMCVIVVSAISSRREHRD